MGHIPRVCDPLKLVVLCGFCAFHLQASSSGSRKLSEFYIVSVGFSDAEPGWHRSILEVKPDGDDLRVRYIRVGPSRWECSDNAVIGATDTRLSNTSMKAVVGGVNLCAVDSAVIEQVVSAFPPTQRMSVMAGDSFTVVATCGNRTKVTRLPGYWAVDMERLQRERPDIASLWTLEPRIGTRSFGHFPTIDLVPHDMAERLRPPGEVILSELESGKFDAGLRQGSFKDDVVTFRPQAEKASIVTLLNADQFRRRPDRPQPARKLILPETRKRCGRFLSVDEVRRLLAIATGREHLTLRILLVGGLRPVELFAVVSTCINKSI